jgi:ElaB/YqjD/DUF883 family membrane-anchored ribosome-binding protein
MGDEPEVIRQQMEQTRSSLTDKIERLEQTVEDKVQTTTAAVACTVESVKDAVQDTVDSVKGSVHDTVESVKDTFNVRRYFAQYPWAAFGAAVGVGIASNVLLSPRRHAARERVGELHSRGQVPTTPSHNGGPRKKASAALANGVASKFDGELEKLKGVALGAAFSLLRDWIGRSASPEVGAKLGEVIDDVTRKFGGEPFRENLLESVSGFVGKISGERDVENEARDRRRIANF